MAGKFEKQLMEFMPLPDGTYAPVVALESVDATEVPTLISKENFRKLKQGFREVGGVLVPVLAVVGAASSEVPTQASRTGSSTAVQADSGTRIPFSGTASFTVAPDLQGFNAQLIRADAGTLTVQPGAGVTLYHNGAIVTTLTVSGKYNWILVMPGLVANEYMLSRYTGA